MIEILSLIYMLNNFTPVIIHNPYSIGLTVEVKCKYYKKQVIKLKGKSKRSVFIPWGTKCEIWPIDYSIFGG